MKLEIDEIDRKIMEILQKNPNISQNEIAKMINLSQPSVSARIKKMRKNGTLSLIFGIDIKKTGLHVGKIELTDFDYDKYKNCPRILSILETNDGYIIFIVSEDFSSMEYFARKNFNKEVKIIIDSFPDFIMPLKMSNYDCKAGCSNCPYYKNGQCMGCPSSLYYKGKLW